MELTQDWSLATSTKARNVYYYRNLDIGTAVVARLNRLVKVENGYLLHTTLVSEDDGLPIGDVLTLKTASSSTLARDR